MMELECSCPKVCSHMASSTLPLAEAKRDRGGGVFVGDHKDGLTDNVVYSELL